MQIRLYCKLDPNSFNFTRTSLFGNSLFRHFFSPIVILMILHIVRGEKKVQIWISMLMFHHMCRLMLAITTKYKFGVYQSC